MSTDKPPLYSKNLPVLVATSNILLVGAGGIGCEVLKNLVLSGFQNIEVIDLDTIDVSNLNRQFLFRKEHVGKSKAEVARESVLKYNPNAKIKAHHASIISSDFGVSFMQNFNVVLNALDNRAARNQVNRVCLSANIPLIESGTSGYLGQVELILKNKTKCYECEPKAPPKTYPGCTIRNTPSEHVHCIVWSKHLFNQLFGIVEEDEEVSPDVSDPDSGVDTTVKWEETKDGNIARVSTRKWAADNSFDPEKIFNKLFKDDIEYLLSMGDLWKDRNPPQPIAWERATSSDETDSNKDRDLRIWSEKECAEVFATCITELSRRFNDMGELSWDKDDPIAMDFVTACANMRAGIFKIEKKSRFETKSVAGNIIPAIATANAIIAGYVVLQTLKVLENQVENCQSVYLRRFPNPKGLLVVPEKHLSPPLPTCFVCAYKPQLVIKCNITKMTCKEFEYDVLKKTLNLPAPDVILSERGTIIISSEEEDNEQNHNKSLSDIGVGDGTILIVDDFIQNYKFEIIVLHMVPENKTDASFTINGALDTFNPMKYINGGKKNSTSQIDYKSDDDDLEIMEETIEEETRKRKPEDEEEVLPIPSKKLKTIQEKPTPSKDFKITLKAEQRMEEDVLPTSSNEIKPAPRKLSLTPLKNLRSLVDVDILPSSTDEVTTPSSRIFTPVKNLRARPAEELLPTSTSELRQTPEDEESISSGKLKVLSEEALMEKLEETSEEVDSSDVPIE